MQYHDPLKPETFVFDRRSFLAKTGTAAAGTFFLPSSFNFAQEVCFKDGAGITDYNLFRESDDKLHYWIDGLHFNELSNVPSRANLSLFMNVKQSDKAYVEKVVLTDENVRTLGVRHFDRNDMMSTGHVPYAMFHNIALDYTKKYFIFYQVKVGTNVVLKRYVLAQAKRSVLNATFLPDAMRADFATFMLGNTGLVTSPFQFYTKNGINLHSARGRIVDIGSDNSFRIDIQLMHGDAGAEHYMRYFIVADPVGRIVGFVKRGADGKILSIEDVSTKPVSISGFGANGAIAVRSLSEDERAKAAIHEDYVARINDCPYIQIFTEDVFDALAKNTIHLV